jgi:hypothetical protein
MTLTKKPARPPIKQMPPLALPLKPGVRPRIRSMHADADPLGLFAGLSAQLKQTYDAQLRAFLRKYDFVRFEPAVRQRIRAAETAPGGPATFLIALTVHPREASGFPRLVGRLPSPSEAPPPDVAEDGQYIRGLFGDKIPVSQLKPAHRSKGRRR